MVNTLNILVYRSANYTKPGQYVKCFHNPEKALILHNHFPLGCLGGVCTSFPVDTGLGHLQHYRQDCVNTLKKSCANDFKTNSVKDTAIWKVKETVIARTNEALQKMGFFGPGRNQLSGPAVPWLHWRPTVTEELWASLHTKSNLTSFVRQEFVHLTQTIMHTLGEPKVPIHFMLNSFRINCPYPSTLRLHVNASFNSIHIKTNSANCKYRTFTRILVNNS